MRFITVLLLLLMGSLNAQKDYRHFQTPVKQQGSRGTCTAFGVAAALESLPGLPSDISEQYLYAALKYSQPNTPYSEGDYLLNYIKSIQQYGIVREEKLPYNPQKIKWEESPREFTRMIQGTNLGKVGLYMASKYARYTIPNDGYIYYNKNYASIPQNIKTHLDRGTTAIAINYGNIHLNSWISHSGDYRSPLMPYFSVNYKGERIHYSEAIQHYPGNLAEDMASQKVPYYYIDEYSIDKNTGLKVPNYGGHVVAIVGYNDFGFIFKNSWGSDWGDNGYGYISYDAHRLMANEALLFSKPMVYRPQQKIRIHNALDIRLKTTVFNKNHKPEYSFSLTTANSNESIEVKKATYRIYYPYSNQLINETSTYQTGRDLLTMSAFPFKNTLMPPGFLFKEKPVKVEVALIDVYGNQIVKTYPAVFFGNDEYIAQN